MADTQLIGTSETSLTPGASAAPAAEHLGLPATRRHGAAPRWVQLVEDQAWPVTSAVADGLALVLAMTVLQLTATDPPPHEETAAALWLYPPLVACQIARRRSYRPRIAFGWLSGVAEIIRASTWCAVVFVALSAAAGWTQPTAGVLIGAWALTIVLVAGSRAGLSLARRSARSEHLAGSPAVIVGSGSVARLVERRLHEHPEIGLRAIGFVDDAVDPDENRPTPLLGPVSRLPEILRESGARDLIVTFMGSRGADAALRPLIESCRELGVRVSIVPRLYEVHSGAAVLDRLGSLPVVSLEPTDTACWRFTLKHCVDRLCAAVALLLLAPLLVAIAVAVKLSSPGPVLLRQTRIGAEGRPFEILKFRSMRCSPCAAASASTITCDTAPGGVEGGDRRTPVGRILRRTSLDELPQLLNVLRGEMSLVGPRPERPEFVDCFNAVIPRYADRHRVRPGITGWAQVHGLRGKTSLADRVEWDNFYVENWSPALDLRIVAMTVQALFYNAE